MGNYAVEFHNVCKQFRLHPHQGHSFREIFINRLGYSKKNDGQQPTSSVFWGLKDVSFAIPTTATVGLIGNNGSGKSTTLKLISQIIYPSSGQITITGQVSALLELGIGFHPDLTGRENVYLNGAILGISRRQMETRLREITEFAEIGAYIDLPVKQYSSGMLARLGFAVATRVDADILIIDEVLAVGDIAFQIKCLNYLKQLRGKKTIIIVAHTVTLLEQLCDQLLWLDRGQVRASGHPSNIISDYIRAIHHASVERNQTNDHNNQGLRYGLFITNIEIINSAGAAATKLTSDDTLRIHIHYEAIRDIPNMVAAIGFDMEYNIRLVGNVTYDDQITLGPAHHHGIVEATYPNLQLATGNYTLTVFLYTAPDPPYWGEVSDVRSCNFEVISSHPYHGPIEVEVQWAHLQA